MFDIDVVDNENFDGIIFDIDQLGKSFQVNNLKTFNKGSLIKNTRESYQVAYDYINSLMPETGE